MLSIIRATAPEHVNAVRSLLLEYWESFGFDPSFQNFSGEVAGLPGQYAPPKGRLALALFGAEAAGCIALRALDEQRCEAKRLYVRDQFRGREIGRELLTWVIAEARAAGYRELLGDTMPSMARALSMYARLGFQHTGPYGPNPTPGAIYLSLRLSASDTAGGNS